MHHLRIAPLLCGMALWAGAALPAAAETSAGECSSKPFMASAANAVTACYAEDGIIWFPGGSMAQGREAIRDGFAHFFSAMEIKDVKLTEIGHVMGEGDTRTAWGTYEIRMVNKSNGAEAVQRGRFTDVSKKVNGRWLYVVDHPSDDPPPSATK